MVGVFFMSAPLKAQERSVVVENFQSNSRYWFVGDLGYAQATLSKGLYNVDRTAESGESVFTIDNFIDPALDFSIEATIQILKSQQGSCGLVWNYFDINNFDAFSISAEGNFRVIVCRFGEVFDLSSTDKGPIYHDAIKKGKWNRLKVYRKGNTYAYFINDVLVFRSEFAGYTHTSHGFYVAKRCRFQSSAFQLQQIQTLQLSSEVVAEKEKLGIEINSGIDESSPLISPDGSQLFFTRTIKDSHNADAWVAKKTKEGKWCKAESLGYPINNKVHNSVVSCAADNRSVLLLNTYFGDGSYKGCCFSQSNYALNQWTLPQDVSISNLNHYGKWLDASLSVDNRTMLLSALRPVTLGYNDLYVSFKTKKGTWSEPLNLGQRINTPFNEASPFLASDNKTLYFSSVGYPGYGNQDIFMSKRLDDSWTNWSTPVNLGPSINTEGFDAFFSIASNEDWAYLVSNKGSLGGTDIFRIQLPSSLCPTRVCILSGKVIDKSTAMPLYAKLFYQSLTNDHVKGTIYTDQKTGAYQIILPDTGSYYITAEKTNYYAQADSISFSYRTKVSHQQNLTLYLDPLLVGKAFAIRQLQFEKTKAVLLSSSIPALEQLYHLLMDNKSLRIRIEGHTDNVGDAQLNTQLSLNRAHAVEQYLVDRGIEEVRMEVKGFGGVSPIADNTKEETRRLNRRVEFVILGKE